MPSSKSGSTGHDPPNSGPDDGEAGPLISNNAAMASELAKHNAEAKRLQAKIELHSLAIQEAHCKMLISSQSLSKAYQNLEKNKKKQKAAKSRSSHQRRPHQPISGDVCNLVEHSIFDQNKKQTEVAKDFQISNRQVRRIVSNAREGKPNASLNRRGPKSKITSDILVSILLHLEEDPKSTLSDLAKLVKDEFDVQISTPAIHKTLKSVDVTWKTVTPVPRKWNEAAFLQQRHNFVLRRATDIGCKIVYVDESGFNLETQASRGYALSGRFFHL
ncbi:hypothetical protein PtA15_10A648 [Puccinia triticina]|uniref:Transposase Tc1-like domain-containing protein n=1 Tax=Puccinia triticina TaxID=208348 RepID=A0ABY7CVC2_9BASI|nr:uncharacterized protein PtA15_10A648 [Puccinia triticina]WAQ89224.1 hypothetical protein PtA15_10A648 [Puccinia triticina]